MRIEIDLTDEKIAQAVLDGDYPDQAQRFDAMGRYMKKEAEQDKYYAWTRYLVEKMEKDGIQFIKDLNSAMHDAGFYDLDEPSEKGRHCAAREKINYDG